MRHTTIAERAQFRAARQAEAGGAVEDALSSVGGADSRRIGTIAQAAFLGGVDIPSVGVLSCGLKCFVWGNCVLNRKSVAFRYFISSL